MYCSQCGKQITDNSKFCSFCGARVDGFKTNAERVFIETPLVDQRKLEQDTRKGILVYLHDVLAMEFSVNKLERELKRRQNIINIHDDWFFWKRFPFQRPIKTSYIKFSNDDSVDRKIGLYLSFSYKLNQYYYMFDDGTKPYYTDINGDDVKHPFGNPCHSYYVRDGAILDQRIRKLLCTPPVLVKKRFSHEYVLTNKGATYWNDEYAIANRNQPEVFEQVKPCIEQFEVLVRKRESEYQHNLPALKREIAAIQKELSDAKKLLIDLYRENLIPAKYRNIGCIYFIHDFFSTSNVPLNNVFLHLDLDKIQSQLDTVIQNQRDIILQQAIIISQNEEILAQNQKLFKELSDMNKAVNNTLNSVLESSNETTEWTRIAALNAEASAWIGIANYIKTSDINKKLG